MITFEQTLMDDRYMDRWKPKDSKAIKIKDMDDDHIRNCIKLIDKIISTYPGEQVYMGDSEYAEMAVEQENAHNEWLLGAYEDKKFRLECELERRNENKLANIANEDNTKGW